MLNKLVHINRLLGFYHNLLTDRQQEVMKLYYGNDYSLAEIAQSFDISRQAVRDNILRAEKQLENYEAKLHLAERNEKRLDLLYDLRQHLKQDSLDQDRVEWILNQLIEMEE